MATTTTATARGRAQDRANVGRWPKHEMQYLAKKSNKPAEAVKQAVNSSATAARSSSRRSESTHLVLNLDTELRDLRTR